MKENSLYLFGLRCVWPVPTH